MGRKTVTNDAAQLIAELYDAGTSTRDIARVVRERLGLDLNQSTIVRHLGRSKPAPTRARAHGNAPHVPRPPEALEPTLDEIPALERRARRLQELLDDEDALTGARDVCALNAELRQTFASIRKARAAQREAAGILSADAQATLARIRKFQQQNQSYPTAVAEPAPQDAPVPAATGTDPRR